MHRADGSKEREREKEEGGYRDGPFVAAVSEL